jgi:hypothetical protein
MLNIAAERNGAQHQQTDPTLGGLLTARSVFLRRQRSKSANFSNGSGASGWKIARLGVTQWILDRQLLAPAGHIALDNQTGQAVEVLGRAVQPVLVRHDIGVEIAGLTGNELEHLAQVAQHRQLAASLARAALRAQLAYPLAQYTALLLVALGPC